MALKSDESSKKYWLMVSNMKHLVNFHPGTQKSKNFTPMGYFCPKYMKFELKKYRGVIFHYIEQWCKIWKTLTLWIQKWHEELGELSSLEHPKVGNLYYIDELFLSQAYTVSAKIFQRNYVMTLKGAAKFKRKLACELKNDIRNLVNFHANTWESKNLLFDWISLSKAYKYLDEKVQKSYVSWNWRVMQSLKENWLLVPNMTWGIWWILMRAVASLEICTLMCYFCQ